MFQPNPRYLPIHAYTPGEQPQEPGFIKLNTNEFPYPAAPEVLEAIKAEATDAIRLYPSPRCEKLREKLAVYHGVGLDNIFVGNGSDEVLKLVIEAYGGVGRAVARVEPTYSLYPNLIYFSRSNEQVYELDDLEGIPPRLFEGGWDLLLLTNPNPPIGTLFAEGDIRRLLECDGLVALDEAYIDFCDFNSLPLLRKHKNLVITRTFSKAFGMAGLRLGYAIGDPEIIENLSKIADSYNVNRISQSAGCAAMDALPYYKEKLAEIRSNREWLSDELRHRGFEVPQSHGNFIFARHEKAKELYEQLKRRKILVRYFSSPLLSNGIRITIGTRQELEALIEVLDSVS